jgi:hypothetical protein
VGGLDILLVVHFSVDGVYLPVFPLLWLWLVRDERAVTATP